MRGIENIENPRQFLLALVSHFNAFNKDIIYAIDHRPTQR